MKIFLLSILSIMFIMVPLSACADVTKACQVVGSEINPTEAQASDNFINLMDGTSSVVQASEDSFVAPIELLVSDITAKVDVAPGANDSYVIYFVADAVRVPGLTCTISGTGTECNTGNDSALIAAGERLTLAIDGGEGAGDPAAAASIEVTACVRRS